MGKGFLHTSKILFFNFLVDFIFDVCNNHGPISKIKGMLVIYN